MRYENIKSAMLVILVLISAILTWNLWTYQPNHEFLEKSPYIEEVAIGEKKDIKKIIRPDRIFYHLKGGHFGTMSSNDIDKVMKEISSWEFSDIQNVTESIGNFKQTVHGKGNAEIIFPDSVPVEMFKSVITFDDKKMPAFEFDRMVINVDNPQKDHGVVYFVSNRNKEVFKSHISLSSLNHFAREFFKNAGQLPRFFALETDKRTIFLPEGETVLNENKFLPHNLDSEQFKNALFSDPIVKKTLVQDGEEYTDGSSKMNVDYNDNMLIYVNPAEDSEYIARSYELLKRSIDFVNEHGGWTDAYRFVKMDQLNQRVTFRMYSIEGYPVFNERGMSEITEVWGRNEINKYIRPNYELGYPLKLEMKKVTLPSGQEALDFLQKIEGFKPQLLEDMMIGYEMERDSEEQKLIVLRPKWFYRYDKVWDQISMDELGGMKPGLE